MPLLGSSMTIDAGSPSAPSTSVFEENMTWIDRSIVGSKYSANEVRRIRASIPADQHQHQQQEYLRHLLRLTATTSSVKERGHQPSSSAASTQGINPLEDTNTNWNYSQSSERAPVKEQRSTFLTSTSTSSSVVVVDDDQISSVEVDSEDSSVASNSTGGYFSESTSEPNSTVQESLAGIGEIELLFGFGSIMEDVGGKFNDSFNESLQYSYNCSQCNETQYVLGEGMYPSGYTLPHIILASILATLLMIVIVVGNMLVIIAIATEKTLKNIQNWFIASLAVADFFLGLVIMPFSLANEIMGYWVFGYWWCDIHSAMDVLLCTASIMNLCLISLDRFWSITQAVDYLKKRTPARAALMIALVWLLSALVCIPPLLGWKRPAPEEEFPKCKLSEDIGYVLYSALGSFYIPSCIMVFVYIRIYFAAKARARRGIKKQPRPRVTAPPESPDVRQTSFTHTTPASEAKKAGASTLENVATIENQPVQIPIVTCDFASDVSTSEADRDGSSNIPMEEKDTLKVSIPAPVQKSNLKATLSVNGDRQGEKSMPSRCRAPSVGIDVDMVSEFEPSSSDSGVATRCAVVKPLKLRICQPIFGRKIIAKWKRDQDDIERPVKTDVVVEGRPTRPRDLEREKKKHVRKKEKKATLILGCIMGSFIACWLPFFLLYIVKPLFPGFEIPSQAFVIAFWLGYMNSALNPFIYTVFNKDFRNAFRRILFK